MEVHLPEMRAREAAPLRRRLRRTALWGVTVLLSALLAIQACTSENVTTVVVNKVSVDPSTASAVEGEFRQFTAEVEDDQDRLLTGATVTWSSGDSTIVSIDSTGLAEALKAGAALVSASFQGATGSGRITVT